MREVGGARLQPQQLGVLLGHDLEDEAIEIRQLLAVGGLAPVARVAIEDEPLPWLVLAQHERPGADDLGGRRLRVPG